VIRIVFVDDEVNVLLGMRRTLHSMRSEWSMEFVASAAAALEELARMPADVIVSDMRMPGMDGWELLAEVKKLYPQTVRLILSGHADARSIMRAVGTAHQYLAKPCQSMALKAAILQTYKLRQLLSSERLARLVGRVDMLPSAPTAFQDIVACLQRPTASIADAAQIVGRDVAMTANVIKLVNSAFFGSRQPIKTADRAVAYLGMDTLGTLVLAHSMFKSGVATGIEGFSLEQLWQHSLQTATAARMIALAEKWTATEAEEAFLAGVLHDVGKIVFATRVAAAADGPAPSVEDAVAHMELHHAEVGAYLLGLWGFPNSIVEAVAFHHAPSHASGEGFGLTGIVHVANHLVHRRSAGDSSLTAGLEAGFLEKLGIADRVTQWSAALSALDGEQAVA
jgi:putative nucleotidyltransferase with HDIG domain